MSLFLCTKVEFVFAHLFWDVVKQNICTLCLWIDTYAKQCCIALYWVSSDHQLLWVKGYVISIYRWERAIQMSQKVLWQQSGELKSLGQNYRLCCYQVKCRKGSVFWRNRNAACALVRVICQQSWELSAAPYLTGNQQIRVFSSDQWFIVSRQPTEVGPQICCSSPIAML